MAISPDTIRVTVPRKAPKVIRKLTKSLYPYVSEDDNGLSRRDFLATVRDRIDQDLDTGDY